MLSSIIISLGHIIDISDGLSFAYIISISFFLINIYIIKKAKKEKNNYFELFFQYSGIIVSIVLIYNVLVFSWYYSVYNEEDTYKLYKYDNYPCKNVVFSTVNKMHLIAHDSSFMEEGAYFITRNTLEEDNMFKESAGNTEYIYKGFYPVGSKWKVIGFYTPYGTTGGNLNYFLVKSIKDHKLAWIASMDFNYKECKPNFYSYETRFHDYPRYIPDENSTGSFINLKKMKILPFK